jgi:streptogramin lyase
MTFAFHRRVVAALSALALTSFCSAGASGAEPVLYQLPPATHAVPFGVGEDGTVWSSVFHGSQSTAPESGSVGSLAPGGAFSELVAPPLERPALGPSGEVWAVEGSGYPVRPGPLNIDRFTAAGAPAGVFLAGQIKGNAYPEIGGPRGVPAMAVTADAVWFARNRGVKARSSIERLSTVDGEVSEHYLPPGYQPTDLAVTPGGTAWFIETDSGRTFITRLRPDGAVRKWQVKGVPGTPVSLAVGISGVVWFGASTEYERGYPTQFGRITRDGKLRLFAAPRADPETIAVGPEGDVWFEQAFGRAYYPRALDSLSVAGNFGGRVCGDPRCYLETRGLVFGPDGNLWYGLQRPNQNHGGGGSGLAIGNEIDNEAGFLGQFRPGGTAYLGEPR